MSFKNYEESGYGINLNFANYLVLVTCFIFLGKWANWGKLTIEGHSP